MILFFIKHYIADFVLQTKWIADNKATDISALFIHSLIHGIGTSLVIALMFNDFYLILGCGLLDLFVHMGIDKLKCIVSKESPRDRMYWIFLGLDQLLHYTFYYALLNIVRGLYA